MEHPPRPSDASPASAPPPGKSDRAVVLVGRLIGRLGYLCLPLGVGALVGFWAADRGMRFVPTALGIALGVFVIGFLAIPAGRILQGRAFADSEDRRRLRKRVVVLLALGSLALALRLVLFAAEMPSPLTELDAPQFAAAFERDCARYRELDSGMGRIVEFFEGELGGAAADAVLTATQERELLGAWSSLYDQAFALDQLRSFYRHWYRFDPSRAERAYHLRSFLLAYAAELGLYERAARLLASLEGHKNAIKFLDAPHAETGLPPSSVSRFRQALTGTNDQARVIAGERYLRLLETGLDGRSEAAALGSSWLWDAVERHLETIEAVSPIDRTKLNLGSDIEVLRRETKRNWYPTQKTMAEWMGDTRFKRIGRYLITAEQQLELDRHLEPGDILLSRKNWYLSNVGLPGFWPHAILYLGAPDKLARYFDTPEVRAYLERRHGRATALDGLLEQRFPAKWARYRRGAEGEPYRVIEAISEGVVFNTLDHAAGDYLVALRPRLDRTAKARAVINVFGHQGKPYDFDFDFATDHALVCTELVWRSYRPSDDEPGLRLPLAQLMGRQTLPANDIARLYAEEHGRPDAQLEFVYFIDASEAEGRARVSTEEAFRASHARPKWDLALP